MKRLISILALVVSTTLMYGCASTSQPGQEQGWVWVGPKHTYAPSIESCNINTGVGDTLARAALVSMTGNVDLMYDNQCLMRLGYSKMTYDQLCTLVRHDRYWVTSFGWAKNVDPLACYYKK